MKQRKNLYDESQDRNGGGDDDNDSKDKTSEGLIHFSTALPM